MHWQEHSHANTRQLLHHLTEAGNETATSSIARSSSSL